MLPHLHLQVQHQHLLSLTVINTWFVHFTHLNMFVENMQVILQEGGDAMLNWSTYSSGRKKDGCGLLALITVLVEVTTEVTATIAAIKAVAITNLWLSHLSSKIFVSLLLLTLNMRVIDGLQSK